MVRKGAFNHGGKTGRGCWLCEVTAEAAATGAEWMALPMADRPAGDEAGVIRFAIGAIWIVMGLIS